MAVNPLTYRYNSLYFLLVTLTLATAQVLGLYHWKNLPAGEAAIDATLSWLILGALVFSIVNTLSFYHPTRGKFLMTLLVPVVLAWLYVKLTTWLSLFFIQDQTYQVLVSESVLYRMSVAYLLLMGAMGFSLLWYQLGEKEESQRRKEEMDRMAKEAELFKLRQQLQPHFLFNSLNSINSLIGSRPAEARSMVQQLSEFLRGTLRREEQKFISLHEELNYLKLYLDIEQVRFGHRLKVEIDCSETGMHWRIPPLILQPLLENAIKFGLYGTIDNLVIRLACSEAENHLELSVTNPYDEDSQPQAGTGFGLKSVKRRLYLLYGRTDLLQLSSEGRLYTVHIKIPKVV